MLELIVNFSIEEQIKKDIVSSRTGVFKWFTNYRRINQIVRGSFHCFIRSEISN